jgi:hypothetical protein
VRYSHYSYLWPPRPELAVPPTMLGFYQKRRWTAQYKKNGTCSVIFVTPEKRVVAKTRHNDDHKAWAPSPATTTAFSSLPGPGWYVLVAELLHSKGVGVRNVNYVHDVLVADGKYLVGTTYRERHDLLTRLFVSREVAHSHYVVDDHTWVARNFDVGFSKMFEEISLKEDEGLVLKNGTAKLAVCSRPTANSSWSVKCRRPTKNYSF